MDSFLKLNYVSFIAFLYSEFSMKTIQRDWDKFYAASASLGTASQKNLYQSRVTVWRIYFIWNRLYQYVLQQCFYISAYISPCINAL